MNRIGLFFQGILRGCRGSARKSAPVFLALALWPGPTAAGVADFTRSGSPNIQSIAALVVDVSSGEVLLERRADALRPIASLSKLAAALVIQKECALSPQGLHQMSVKNREAARGGDKSVLRTGWQYSHRDLLHAALMRSDNRALPALGEACGLTPIALAGRMKEVAGKIGLTRTCFREPNGLSLENVSTAREVMTLLREALKDPVLAEILGKRSYVLFARKGSQTLGVEIQSTDRLLSKGLARVLGGKTGYTDIARYCLAIGARTLSGRDLGMVFLGAEGRHTRFADFTRVIKWLERSGADHGPGEQVSRTGAAGVLPDDGHEGKVDASLAQ